MRNQIKLLDFVCALLIELDIVVTALQWYDIIVCNFINFFYETQGFMKVNVTVLFCFRQFIYAESLRPTCTSFYKQMLKFSSMGVCGYFFE